MPASNHKIVVDTNWLISYLVKKQQSNFHLILINENISLYTSEEQIIEFKEKIIAENFRKYFTLNETIQFLIAFTYRPTFIKITSSFIVSRDPKDNYLLSLAHDLTSGFIVTGDKNLLDIKQFKNIQIVKLNQFPELINQPS